MTNTHLASRVQGQTVARAKLNGLAVNNDAGAQVLRQYSSLGVAPILAKSFDRSSLFVRHPLPITQARAVFQ